MGGSIPRFGKHVLPNLNKESNPGVDSLGNINDMRDKWELG
jgi:hypothetical protein